MKNDIHLDIAILATALSVPLWLNRMLSDGAVDNKKTTRRKSGALFYSGNKAGSGYSTISIPCMPFSLWLLPNGGALSQIIS